MKRLLITTTLVAFATSLCLAVTPEKGKGNNDPAITFKSNKPQDVIKYQGRRTEIPIAPGKWRIICDPKNCTDWCAIHETDHVTYSIWTFPAQTCDGGVPALDPMTGVGVVSVDGNGNTVIDIEE